jgi:hypothetical protein
MRSWIGSIASKLERARLMMRFNRKLKDRLLVAEIERKNKTKKLQMRKKLLIDDINLRERENQARNEELLLSFFCFFFINSG